MHIANEDPRTTEVQKILVDCLGIGTHKIGPDTRLVEDMGADSLDYVELIMAFEEAFDIEIPDESVEKDDKCQLATVKDILDYLNHRLGPAEPIDGVLNLTDAQFCDRYKAEEENGECYVQREWDKGKSEKLIKQAIDEKRCWTAIDDDDGEFMIVWGNRMVNRLYNVITSKPIENEDWNVQVQDPYDQRWCSCTVIWDEDGEDQDIMHMPPVVCFRMLDLEKQTSVCDITEENSSDVADFISDCTGWAVKSFDYHVYESFDALPGEPEVISP